MLGIFSTCSRCGEIGATPITKYFNTNGKNAGVAFWQGAVFYLLICDSSLPIYHVQPRIRAYSTVQQLLPLKLFRTIVSLVQA
jgi:hypothetical protein